MSADDTQGNAGTPSNKNENNSAGGNGDQRGKERRDSRAPAAKKKRRRPTRNSRIPKPPAKSETREVEEQSLGPGRKKRIFKRRKPRPEGREGEPGSAPDATSEPQADADDTSGNRRAKRARSGQSRPGNEGGEHRRGKNRSHLESKPKAPGADAENRSARKRRSRNPGKVEQRTTPKERNVALNVVDNAPDGAFIGDDYTDLDPRANTRNVPSYSVNDEAEMLSPELFFSGRQGQDFASMTESELDFLKPHDANEEELYQEMPELDITKPQKGKLMDIVGVKTHRSGIIEPFDCEDLILARGDEVIVETDRGLAIGEVMVPTTRRWVKKEVPRVFRAATPNDMRQRDRNMQKAAEAFELCQKSIVSLKLVMKLVEVMYLHGGNKAVFYFMAEGRVDFRQLVKDLARELHIRVEMRQIGVRDASRMIGGLGTCGLLLCCTRYIREFAPVSIRMAKDQDLVLNPEKVSGQCGRLMCCLAYEEEVYKEKGKLMPRVGKMVETPEGCGRVRDRDILRGLVRVEIEGEHGLRPFEITDIRPIKPAGGDGNRSNRKDASQRDSSETDSDASAPSDETNDYRDAPAQTSPAGDESDNDDRS